MYKHTFTIKKQKRVIICYTQSTTGFLSILFLCEAFPLLVDKGIIFASSKLFRAADALSAGEEGSLWWGFSLLVPVLAN